MSTRTASRIAWSLWVLALALAAIGLWLLWVDRSIPIPQSWGFRGFEAFFALSFSTVGVLVASRHPNNPIGWLFVALGVQSSLQLLTEEYGIYALLARPGSLPAGLAIAWVQNWIWILAVGPFMTFLLLLFPTGRLSSRRWRPVAWLAGASIAAFIFGIAFLPGPIENFAGLNNPYALEGPLPMVLLAGGGLLFVTSMVLSATSLVRRMRRAAGEEREQLKWFAYAAGLAVLTLTASFLPFSTRIEALWVDAIELLAILSIGAAVVAVGVAILRYRLYDIDLIINRTLVYGPLTAILAGTYIASIQLFRVVFVGLTGQTSDAAVVLTTLVIASAFTPLKGRLQTLVDQRFRETPDPTKNLIAFRQQLRSVVQVLQAEQVTRRFLEEATAAFHARSGAVYLNLGGQEKCVATYGLPNDQEVVRVSLECDGATVGLLSLGPRRGGLAYTPKDRDALQQTAGVVAEAIALAQPSMSRSA